MRHCALKRWHRRRQLGRLGAPCLRTLNPGSLHGNIRGTRALHVNIQGAAYTEGAECRTRRSNRSVSTQKQPKRAEQRRAGYQQCTWVYFVPRVATRGETVSSTPDLIPTSGQQFALASTGPRPSGKMSRHLGIAMPSCVWASTHPASMRDTCCCPLGLPSARRRLRRPRVPAVLRRQRNPYPLAPYAPHLRCRLVMPSTAADPASMWDTYSSNAHQSRCCTCASHPSHQNSCRLCLCVGA